MLISHNYVHTDLTIGDCGTEARQGTEGFDRIEFIIIIIINLSSYYRGLYWSQAWLK